jgi:hypothetical protein
MALLERSMARTAYPPGPPRRFPRAMSVNSFWEKVSSIQWQMRLVPGHAVVPHPLVTLRPKGGMPMALVRRTSAI